MSVFQNLMKKYLVFHYRVFGDYAYLGVEQFVRAQSLVGDHHFYNSEDFPWVKEVEAEWETIRAELDEVLKDRENIPSFIEVSPEQKKIAADGDKWKTFFLYGYGHAMEKNLKRCPETAKVLEKIPGMKTAFFSILAPGKYIPPHRGPYTGVLRYHMGLIVPEPNEKVRIRVGDEIRHWQEGKSLIFDDTYEHEVWNETDGTRVVLFVDFERPLKGFAQKLNRKVLNLIERSGLVQDAKNNIEKLSGEKIAKRKAAEAAKVEA